MNRRPQWVRRAEGPTPAERVLWERRKGTVGQAIDELHERAADLARVYGLDLAAEAGVSEGTLHTLALITPDNPDGMEKHINEDGQVLYVPKGLGAVQPHRQFLSGRAA